RETLEDLLGAATVLAPAEVVPQPDQLQILATGKEFVYGGVLAGQADSGAQPCGVGDDVVAGDTGAPAVGLEQGRQDPHERRLAGAVRAEQGQDHAPRSAEIDPSQGPCLAEALRYPFHLNDRL